MAEKFSHKNCGHPSTPAARGICRKNQAALAEVAAKKLAGAPRKQHELTKLYRGNLLELAGTTVEQITDRLGLTEADLADIDAWFEREMADLIKVIEREHKKAALLTTSYLRQHAALLGLGYPAGTVPPKVVMEQLEKSLSATGPGAFKKHIAGGGTEAEALKVMQTTLPGAAERLAMQGARDTLTDAVEASETPTLGYTRRTSGSACEYCRGLSTDPVYVGSKDVKTFHAHDHCTCTGEPFYVDDDRKAVNRLTDAEQFAEQFAALKKFGVPVGKMANIAYDADVDIHGYVRDGYTVNAVLRGTSKVKKTRTDVDIATLVDEMTYKFGPAPEDFAVWRGMLHGDKIFGKERWAGNLEGLKWSDDAFTSTTMHEDFATSWLSFLADPKLKKEDRNSVKLNLIVRAGSQVLHITGNNQFEILLERGAKFRVVKDHGFDEDLLVRVLDVEVTY